MTDSLTTLMQEHRNQLRQEWPWVWLYELEVPSDPITRVRLTNMPQPVTFSVDSDGAAITYSPFPIVHGGIKKTASGDIQTMGVSVANVTREIGLLFDRYDGLDGANAVIRLVNMADLDNPKAQLEERADYIPLDRLESETAVTDFYVSAVSTDGTDLRL